VGTDKWDSEEIMRQCWWAWWARRSQHIQAAPFFFFLFVVGIEMIEKEGFKRTEK